MFITAVVRVKYQILLFHRNVSVLELLQNRIREVTNEQHKNNIKTDVEDFTSSGFENIFYHLKSHPFAFIHGKRHSHRQCSHTR